jgi:hypothetical protein
VPGGCSDVALGTYVRPGHAGNYSLPRAWAVPARAILVEDPSVLLDKYRIRLFLLSKNTAMTQVLPYLSGWKEVYSDDVSASFVR